MNVTGYPRKLLAVENKDDGVVSVNAFAWSHFGSLWCFVAGVDKYVLVSMIGSGWWLGLNE